MHVMFRLSPLVGVLLFAAAPFAAAESPLPDPVAPAVIGPPLDQIRPARSLHHRTAGAKPKRHMQVPAMHTTARARRHAAVAIVPARTRPAPVSQPVAVQQAPVQQAVIVREAPVPQQRVATQAMGANRAARFSSQDEMLVRRYYEAHPASAQVVQWKIGEPIPPKAALTGVPDDLRGALSPLPPGHQYVEVDGDVVMVAVQSRVVVDGISRGAR